MKKALRSALVVGLVVFLGACVRHSNPGRSPDEVVRNFITLSASAKDGSDKDRLKELCTGHLQNAFERMTEEAFRILYLGNNLKIVDLKIVSSTIENDTAKVHYQVTVENNQGTDPTQERNEREVTLTKGSGGWLIDTIQTQGTDQIAFTRGMIF